MTSQLAFRAGACATLLLLAGPIVQTAPESRTYAFEDGGWGGEGHKEITRNALDFLWPSVVSLLVEKNNDEDAGAANNMPERHFTNCRFQESAVYVNQRYFGAMVFASNRNTRDAVTYFGLLLHGIQDFYSHSAWVDPPPMGLGFGRGGRKLDDGLSWWRVPRPYEVLTGNVVFVEGNPPPGTTIDLPRDLNTGKPTSVVPIVTRSGVTLRGLMTSSAAPLDGGRGECPPADPAPADPDDHCMDDASVCVRHNVGSCDQPLVANCFHHDNANRPNFSAAFDAAVVQTEHEWCRLLHLLKGIKDGHRTASSVMALWVKQDVSPNATPHPRGTGCSREAGTVAIQVRLTELASAKPIRWFDNFAFVSYTVDYRASNRSRFLGKLPSSQPTLTLCAAESDTLVMSTWRWRSLLPWNAFAPSSQILGGATWTFPISSVQPVGTRFRRQVTVENLQARFEVVRTGAC